ncbi:MAG: nucleotidyl transferase AbiEii/AbiGii toxin family protein [Patescibacteria group bacterium]|nr:nucleotidyl transferase AbiEii/AbiGii toxin family protein [Patescibacteria group bacterium]
MLVNSLARTVNENQDEPKIFLRNLLKEVLQGYTLNFIYTSNYQDDFLFTGGTCLRFCFGLNRLSEDLDLDIKNEDDFELDKFLVDLGDYYQKDLQFKDLEIKTAGNERQVYLKFPVLRELGLAEDDSESNILFLRLDINPLPSLVFSEDVSMYSSADFSFVIRRYSLEDIFASKLAAILTREFEKGGGSATFKGRDYYDLIWFLQKDVEPNYERIEDLTEFDSREVILKNLDEKVQAVSERALEADLLPLFDNPDFVKDFSRQFKELYSELRPRLA